MKLHWTSSFLSPGLLLAASLAHAQATPPPPPAPTYTYVFGYGVTQGDPNLVTSPLSNFVNFGCSASTGGNENHTATLQYVATVTYKGANRPSSVTVPYQLVNTASGTVKLGGLTPPTGTGQGYGDVDTAHGDTGVQSRTTTYVEHTNTAGPTAHNRSTTVTTPLDSWTDNGDGTWTTFVVLESCTLTVRARIDAVLGSGGRSRQVDGDDASGSVQQGIQAKPSTNS